MSMSLDVSNNNQDYRPPQGLPKELVNLAVKLRKSIESDKKEIVEEQKKLSEAQKIFKKTNQSPKTTKEKQALEVAKRAFSEKEKQIKAVQRARNKRNRTAARELDKFLRNYLNDLTTTLEECIHTQKKAVTQPNTSQSSGLGTALSLTNTSVLDTNEFIELQQNTIRNLSNYHQRFFSAMLNKEKEDLTAILTKIMEDLEKSIHPKTISATQQNELLDDIQQSLSAGFTEYFNYNLPFEESQSDSSRSNSLLHLCCEAQYDSIAIQMVCSADTHAQVDKPGIGGKRPKDLIQNPQIGKDIALLHETEQYNPHNVKVTDKVVVFHLRALKSLQPACKTINPVFLRRDAENKRAGEHRCTAWDITASLPAPAVPSNQQQSQGLNQGSLYLFMDNSKVADSSQKAKRLGGTLEKTDASMKQRVQKKLETVRQQKQMQSGLKLEMHESVTTERLIKHAASQSRKKGLIKTKRPRSGGGQNTVMGGISANEVAHVLGYEGVGWNWCHLIAHSMGKSVAGGKPQTLQTPENLVVGTAQANAMMLLVETAIKKVVLKRREPLEIIAIANYESLEHGDFHFANTVQYRVRDPKTNRELSFTFDMHTRRCVTVLELENIYTLLNRTFSGEYDATLHQALLSQSSLSSNQLQSQQPAKTTVVNAQESKEAEQRVAEAKEVDDHNDSGKQAVNETNIRKEPVMDQKEEGEVDEEEIDEKEIGEEEGVMLLAHTDLHSDLEMNAKGHPHTMPTKPHKNVEDKELDAEFSALLGKLTTPAQDKPSVRAPSHLQQSEPLSQSLAALQSEQKRLKEQGLKASHSKPRKPVSKHLAMNADMKDAYERGKAAQAAQEEKAKQELSKRSARKPIGSPKPRQARTGTGAEPASASSVEQTPLPKSRQLQSLELSRQRTNTRQSSQTGATRSFQYSTNPRSPYAPRSALSHFGTRPSGSATEDLKESAARVARARASGEEAARATPARTIPVTPVPFPLGTARVPPREERAQGEVKADVGVTPPVKREDRTSKPQGKRG